MPLPTVRPVLATLLSATLHGVTGRLVRVTVDVALPSMADSRMRAAGPSQVVHLGIGTLQEAVCLSPRRERVADPCHRGGL